MSYIDKNNSLEKIKSQNEIIILELGCGNSKQFTNSISIDLVDINGVDIVCDLNKGFPFIPDNSIDEIHSVHFLEHIDNLGNIMKEIHRILKPKGIKIITVPHFSIHIFIAIILTVIILDYIVYVISQNLCTSKDKFLFSTMILILK